MDPQLKQTLLFRILMPLAALGVMLLVGTKKRLPWRDGVGVRAPTPRLALAWLLGWCLWVWAADLLGERLGQDAMSDWSGRSAALLALTGVGMVLLFPVLEELVFRGLLFYQLGRTRLGLVGAVVLPALLFALLHVQYGALGMGFVLLDGLLFGLARAHSRSVLLPMAMHVLGNLYAYLERLPR